MSVNEKVALAESILRLEKKRRAIYAFLNSNMVKKEKIIEVSYNIHESVIIEGRPFGVIIEFIKGDLRQIESKIETAKI